jgi:CHAT domain-containing protein
MHYGRSIALLGLMMGLGVGTVQVLPGVAQSIGQTREGRKAEADWLLDQGIQQYHRSQFKAAFQSWQNALNIYREIKYRLGEGRALGNLGNICDALGNYPKAIEYQEQHLAIAREIKDRREEGAALGNLGIVYQSLGNYPKAIEYQEQHLAIAREIKDSWAEGAALGNLGVAYDIIGNYAKAIEYQEKRLEIARELRDRQGESQSLGGLGNIYDSLGNYPKAIEYHEQHLAIARELNDRDGERISFNNIGNILMKKNQIDLAILFHKQSVNISESIRKENQSLSSNLQASYTERVASTYRNLADLLIAQGRIGEAQQVLERLKLQELNDFTKGTRSATTISDIELNTNETKIKDKHTSLIAFGQKYYNCDQPGNPCPQYNELKTQYQTLSKEFQAFVESIKTQRTEDRATNLANATKDFQNAKRIIDANPDSILIYPLVLEDKTRILWSSKGGVFSKNAVCPLNQKILSAKVEKFSSLLSNRGDETQLKAVGKELYDCLIKPIEPELTANQIKHLIFIPDRITNYIPFGALHDGKQYLAQRYATSNILAVSITNIRDTLPKNVQDVTVAGFGLSVAKENGKFPALHNVDNELHSIIKTTPQDKSGLFPGKIFLNEAFDRATLERQFSGHKIIHIATHGEFVAGNARSSFFLLGNGEHFTIPDIQSLQHLQDVHLVILSACETGKGGTTAENRNRAEIGSEVAGLSSYFIGDPDIRAKAVLSSLWKVSDNSTALMMQQFYTHISQGMTKAQAIRAVQQDFIDAKLTPTTAANLNRSEDFKAEIPPEVRSLNTPTNFRHPYYWAPFILIGNSQ